jgi:hypothetical protein
VHLLAHQQHRDLGVEVQSGRDERCEAQPVALDDDGLRGALRRGIEQARGRRDQRLFLPEPRELRMQRAADLPLVRGLRALREQRTLVDEPELHRDPG